MTQISLDLSFNQLRERAGLSIPEAARRVGYSPRTVQRWDRGLGKPKQAVIEFMKNQIPDRSFERSEFTFIDLFAGIGGLRRGFEAVGGRCIFTSEWDRYSQKTYRANFPDDEHEIAGDIRQVASKEVPEHDVLLAGFPCQPFSIAGVSKKNALSRPHGFACEAQGTLFYEVARIIADRRPKAFLLENVKNLVNHDKGCTFKVICDILKQDLQYKVQWRVLNAKAWVPQHRERIFIVGFREENDFDFSQFEIPNQMPGPTLANVLHLEGDEPDLAYTTEKGTALPRYTLSDHLWGYLRGYAEKHRIKGNGFGFGLFGPEDVARTLSARYYKDGSEILIRQPNSSPRRLTPRECARLMGFDSPGRSSIKIPVSDTQAYRQFGNSVVVPVVEAVARAMDPWLPKAKTEHAKSA